jgi:hypothetical protein
MVEALSVGIAVVSFGMSLYVLFKQRRDAGRAHFTAEWEDTQTLVYVNHGPGPAYEVKGTLRSSKADRDQVQETPYIGAFQTSRVPVTRTMYETFGPMELSWRDNRRVLQRLLVTLHAQPNPRTTNTANAPEIEKAVRAIALDVTRRELDGVARKIRRRLR